MRDTLIFEDVVQGTPEWLALRAGAFTASEFDKVITPKTLKPSSQLDGYIARLISETFLGVAEESHQSAWMAWGLQFENEARRFYQMERGIDTERPGFIWMDDRKVIGCSPDAMGLEIKCPKPETHVRYLLDGVLPSEYVCQVQGLMYVVGAETWDFLSYYPGLPAFLITVERDPVFQERLGEELENAVAKLHECQRRIAERFEVES